MELGIILNQVRNIINCIEDNCNKYIYKRFIGIIFCKTVSERKCPMKELETISVTHVR
jgi:hypothetical protein